MAEKEYIEREALLDRIRGTGYAEPIKSNLLVMAVTIPAADVREVVRATWERVMEQPYLRKRYHVVACSACHKRGNQGWNFCPNCGADMREEI